MKNKPEFEIVDCSTDSVRYLEHGWPSELCRWHAHHEYELHLITETKGKAFIGDYIGEFNAGDFFLVGPLLPHNWCSYEHQAEVKIRDKLLQFDYKNLSDLCDIFPEYNVLKSLLNQAKYGIQFIGYDFKQANAQLLEIKNSSGIRRINLFLHLLESLLHHKTKKSLSAGFEFSKMSETEENRISQIIDYVMCHYQEKITINEVAKYTNMSGSNFSRYFHNRTGRCFGEFVNTIRISHACNLLLDSEQNISTICYDVGFNNLSHFNRHFLRTKGTTPKVFRQKIRSDFPIQG